MRHIEEAFNGLAGYLELAAYDGSLLILAFKIRLKNGLRRLDWPFLSKKNI